MKVRKVKRHKPSEDWSILIEDFDERDYKYLIRTIKLLGFERNTFAEKRSLALGGGIRAKEILARKYGDSTKYLDILYYVPEHIIAMSWRCGHINGEELLSILLSERTKTPKKLKKVKNSSAPSRQAL